MEYNTVGKTNVTDPQRISTLDTLLPTIHRNTPLTQHKKRCSICNHKLKDEIEDKIINQTFKSTDFKKYRLSENIYYSHIKYCNLDLAIEEQRRLLALKLSVRLNDKDARLPHQLTRLDQLNKEAGAYKEADKNINVKTYQQIAELVNPDLITDVSPTITGDDVPLLPVDK